MGGQHVSVPQEKGIARTLQLSDHVNIDTYRLPKSIIRQNMRVTHTHVQSYRCAETERAASFPLHTSLLPLN